MLVDPDCGSAESRPPVEHAVSELDLKAAGVDERSLVVVATHGHDGEPIEQALAAGLPYTGSVGSRPLATSVLEHLKSRGLFNEILTRVQVPPDLNLGKLSHREVVVGVLAESGKPREAGELVRGVPPERPEVADAIDPAGGMTVEVGPHATR
jgi:xanthine/CO dehydrogenase XdhC/CoxF family maturation factor